MQYNLRALAISLPRSAKVLSQGPKTIRGQIDRAERQEPISMLRHFIGYFDATDEIIRDHMTRIKSVTITILPVRFKHQRGEQAMN
jgi:hypothetical protein